MLGFEEHTACLVFIFWDCLLEEPMEVAKSIPSIQPFIVACLSVVRLQWQQL